MDSTLLKTKSYLEETLDVNLGTTNAPQSRASHLGRCEAATQLYLSVTNSI